MDAHVVCSNCKMGHEIPYDKKTDRPKSGFVCTRCQTKITQFVRKSGKILLYCKKLCLLWQKV